MEAFKVQRAFLLDCTEALILDHGHTTAPEERATDLQDVVMVKLASLLLKSLDILGRCTALRICILNDNFLTSIEPLAECVNVVKLDLKSNQIEQLPESSFWSHLKELQVLYLHNNSVAERKNINGLSGCPKLTALTLYDTPLSLTPNYRHSVINSIWALKALDNYVISDEEVIEDWHLPPKFKAKSPHLYIRLYSSAAVNSYKAEMKMVHGIIGEINRIQAVCSPGLIIQKWIRGHLTRRSLGLIHTPWPRSVLGRQVTPASTLMTPPASTVRTIRTSWIKSKTHDPNVEQRDFTVTSDTSKQANMLQDAMSVTSVDNKKLKVLSVPCNTPLQSEKQDTHRAKLNMASVDDLHDEVMGKETFHVSGFKATMHLSEPYHDMVRSRKADGQDIRDAIGHLHMQKPKPPFLHRRLPNTTTEKRPVGTVRLSLAPIRLLERAYWARVKEEHQQEQEEQVATLRAWRDDARRCRDGFVEARRKEVLLQRDEDRDDLEKTLRLQRDKREQEVQLARWKHYSFLEEKRRRAAEQELVRHFSQQHGYVSKVIARLCARQRQCNAQHEERRQVGISKQHTRSHLLQENRKEKIQKEALASQL